MNAADGIKLLLTLLDSYLMWLLDFYVEASYLV